MIDGQDANTPVTLAAGSYKTSYEVTNPNKNDVTLTKLVGVDGNEVKLAAPVVLKANETTTIDGANVELADGAKVGGVATVTGSAVVSYANGMETATEALTATDPAYAVAAVPESTATPMPTPTPTPEVTPSSTPTTSPTSSTPQIVEGPKVQTDYVG